MNKEKIKNIYNAIIVKAYFLFRNRKIWLDKIINSNVWRFFIKNKNVVIGSALLFVMLLAIVFYLQQPKVSAQYYKESTFCKSDSECELYDCTNCGNQYWIGKKIRNNSCDKSIAGLIGCKCVEGVCKRNYLSQ